MSKASSNVIKVQKPLNAGFVNQANLCWLNSALQVLEVTPLPLLLKGSYEQFDSTTSMRNHTNIIGVEQRCLTELGQNYVRLHDKLACSKMALEATSIMVCQSQHVLII